MAEIRLYGVTYSLSKFSIYTFTSYWQSIIKTSHSYLGLVLVTFVRKFVPRGLFPYSKLMG